MSVPLVLILAAIAFFGYKTKGWGVGVLFLGMMLHKAGAGVALIESPTDMGLDLVRNLVDAIGGMFGGKKAAAAGLIDLATTAGIHAGLVR